MSRSTGQLTKALVGAPVELGSGLNKKQQCGLDGFSWTMT